MNDELFTPVGNRAMNNVPYLPRFEDQLEELLFQFDETWNQPDVEQLRTACPTDVGYTFILEMIRIDLNKRNARGLSVDAIFYLQAFPLLAVKPELFKNLQELPFNPRTGDTSATNIPTLSTHDLSKKGLASTLLNQPSSAFPANPQYELIRPLGHGGMGYVYLALDKRRNKLIALKTLAIEKRASLLRFKQEFRRMIDLRHPNLVELFDLAVEQDQWYFTMEYVDGVSFLDWVRPRRQFCDIVRLRSALTELSTGVHALHLAGIIHRDLKPSNVMVTDRGRVVILDFGLSAETDQRGEYQSMDQNIIGTPAYMAPEQMMSSPVSYASDWYSVGVMLYEALTGDIPFHEEKRDFWALREAKQFRQPQFPKPIGSCMPPELEALCMDLLQSNKTVRPEGAEVLGRLGETNSEKKPSESSSRVFVGRVNLLSNLQAAFDELISLHKPQFVEVNGPSGIGKSALVQHFLEDLKQQHPQAVLLTGRCFERESVPFKAVDSLMDSISKHLRKLPLTLAQLLLPTDVGPLVRVFPVLAEVPAIAQAPQGYSSHSDPQVTRRRAFGGLRDLLTRLGQRQIVVLAIDDLQWGDMDSASLLAELFRPPDAPCLMVVVSYRSENTQASSCLQFVTEATSEWPSDLVSRQVLVVPPLTSSEVASLSQTVSNEELSEWNVNVLTHESGGNPMFVQELLRHALEKTNGENSRRAMSLDEVLWRRIQTLPIHMQSILQCVALTSRPVTPAVIARATGITASVEESLDELKRVKLLRGIIAEKEERIECYHDRVRETVLAHTVKSEFQTLHELLALALIAEREIDPEEIASHYEGAGNTEQAGHWYAEAAARASRSLAFDRAARLYRLALDLRSLPAVEDAVLRASMADALANAGRGTEAAVQFLRASNIAQETNLSINYHKRAVDQLLRSGCFDQGRTEIQNLVIRCGLKMPKSHNHALVSVLINRFRMWLKGLNYQVKQSAEVDSTSLERLDICWNAAVGFSMTDNILGAAFHSRHYLDAFRLGNIRSIALSMSMESGYVVIPGARGKKKSKALFDHSCQLARELNDPKLLAMSYIFGGAVSGWCLGEWKQSVEWCIKGEEILRIECHGVAWELTTARIFWLALLAWMGDFRLHYHTLQEYRREAMDRGDQYAATSLYLLTYSYFTRLAADDPEPIYDDIHHVMQPWSKASYHLQHFWATYALVETDLYSGRYDSAWNRLQNERVAVQQSMILRVQTIHLFYLYLKGRCAIASASMIRTEGPKPEAIVRGCLKSIRKTRVNWAQALVHSLEAMLLSRNSKQKSSECLKLAAECFERHDMMLHANACIRQLGELVGGEEGKQLVIKADEWMACQRIVNPPKMTQMLLPGFIH